MNTIPENTDTFLADNGIKPSYQRIRIFDYLLKNKIHPTVDTIHQSIVKDIPTLSKTTVYSTLKLFHKKGIIMIINIEDNETRYDADTSLHGHFKCNECGTVFDFKTDLSEIKLKDIADYQVEEYHIYLKGKCKSCKLL